MQASRLDTSLNQFFIGTLDEVVVYTRALSAAEVSDYVAVVYIDTSSPMVKTHGSSLVTGP